MIFAYIVAPSSALANWLLCFASALWIANQANKFIRDFRGSEPQPPNASLELADAALKERVANIERAIESIWTTMRAEDDRTRRELTQFAKDVERAVGRLEGTVKEWNKA